MLLTLVAAINHGGQPKFSVEQKSYPGAFEDSLSPRNRLLNALTTLLVRNYEIVATAVNSSYYKVLAIRMMDSESVEQLEDADTDDESEYQETAEPSKSATIPDSDTAPPGVIAITNPQDGDGYLQEQVGNLCLVEKGASHIGERFGDWDVLLSIP